MFSLDRILSDAKKLAARLKDHDSTADCLIGSTQNLQKQVDSVKTYQENLAELQLMVKQQIPKTNVTVGLIQENSEIRELLAENKALKESLDEHQSTLELIMSRYRLRVSGLLSDSKENRNGVDAITHQELEEKTHRIYEMAWMMKEAIVVDDGEDFSQEQLAQLRLENRSLRELVQISATYGYSLAFGEAQTQTDEPLDTCHVMAMSRRHRDSSESSSTGDVPIPDYYHQVSTIRRAKKTAKNTDDWSSSSSLESHSNAYERAKNNQEYLSADCTTVNDGSLLADSSSVVVPDGVKPAAAQNPTCLDSLSDSLANEPNPSAEIEGSHKIATVVGSITLCEIPSSDVISTSSGRNAIHEDCQTNPMPAIDSSIAISERIITLSDNPVTDTPVEASTTLPDLNLSAASTTLPVSVSIGGSTSPNVSVSTAKTIPSTEINAPSLNVACAATGTTPPKVPVATPSTASPKPSTISTTPPKVTVAMASTTPPRVTVATTSTTPPKVTVALASTTPAKVTVATNSATPPKLTINTSSTTPPKVTVATTTTTPPKVTASAATTATPPKAAAATTSTTPPKVISNKATTSTPLKVAVALTSTTPPKVTATLNSTTSSKVTVSSVGSTPPTATVSTTSTTPPKVSLTTTTTPKVSLSAAGTTPPKVSVSTTAPTTSKVAMSATIVASPQTAMSTTTSSSPLKVTTSATGTSPAKVTSSNTPLKVSISASSLPPSKTTLSTAGPGNSPHATSSLPAISPVKSLPSSSSSINTPPKVTTGILSPNVALSMSDPSHNVSDVTVLLPTSGCISSPNVTCSTPPNVIPASSRDGTGSPLLK